MRTLTLLASALALTIAASACVTETAEPAPKPKSSKTKKPEKETPNGEHGPNTTAGGEDEPEPGTTIAAGTWENGKSITENGTIDAGQTVTIAPGAKITLAAGVSVTVKGTLKVDSAATPATLTGTGWGGLVIAEGGTLAANGLVIEGAKEAIRTKAGNAGAKIENGTIKAETPFNMDPGSKLEVVKTKVTASAGSALAGTFTASYMDYDKTTAPGLTMSDPAGTFTVTDSTFHGTGKSGDFIISSGAKLLSLSYSTVANSHCGLHFGAVDKFELDHVTIENNDYGAMLWGSKADATHTIKATNFLVNADYDAHIQGTNGKIEATGSFMKDYQGLTQTAKATAALTDAKPRPAM